MLYAPKYPFVFGEIYGIKLGLAPLSLLKTRDRPDQGGVIVSGNREGRVERPSSCSQKIRPGEGPMEQSRRGFLDLFLV